MEAFDTFWTSAENEALVEKTFTTICAKDVYSVNNTICESAVKEMANIIVPVLA
jgi:hypothetical protein